MASLTMRAAQPSDVPRLVEIYFEAFHGNAVQERVFRYKSAEAHAFWVKVLSSDLGEAHIRCQVLEDAATGEVVAFAKWQAPLPAGAKPAPMVPFDMWPSDGDREAAEVFFGDLAVQHERIMGVGAPGSAVEDSTVGGGTVGGDGITGTGTTGTGTGTTDSTAGGSTAEGTAGVTPHWYLELIATHPAHQGRGAAGRLLRYGEAQADAAGLPCYLDATPDGRPVYSSAGHGFHPVLTKTYFDNYTHVFMVRDPRPVVGGGGEAR